MSGWRDVLVVAEPRGADPHAASLEVLGKARELADRLGARVLCAWPGGAEQAEGFVHRGADEVLLLEGGAPAPRALAATLAELARTRRPEMVLLAATRLGDELAGRLAAALGTGVLGHCTDLDLDEAARRLVGKRAPHGGRLAEAAIVPEARPQVATLRPGAARAPWPDDGRTGRTTPVELVATGLSRQRMIRTEAQGAPAAWRGAERLVVGGALLDAQGFEDLRAVAGSLGAAWAATRPAAALGLAPEERALRPWDAFPAPRLCVAAGIEDPLEFRLALPPPAHLVVLGDGALARVAQQVVPGPAGATLRALARTLAAR